MIEINGLTKSFGELEVLKGISLTIPRGMMYGLVGRSGAGKSTLLRCINGLESYDNGQMLVDGVDVKSLSRKAMREFRKDIGMIFQQFSLLERLSVYENIALPLRCWNYGNDYIDKKVKELLELVEIPDKIRSMSCELSGGQKQRVAIARALTMNPKLLLCDEATSALDPKTAKAIIALLNRINQELGITMVIVTHQMSVLRSTCEEIAIMEHGQLSVKGPVEQIFMEQPQALKNLIGEKEMLLLAEGSNIRILLSHETSSQPIFTRMARELGIDFMILGGEMESYKNTTLGSIIINVSYEKMSQVAQYLDEHRVKWELLDQAAQMAAEVEE